MKAGDAISQVSAWLVVNNDNEASELTSSNDAIGNRVSLAPGVVTAGQYFWALVRGEGMGLVAGNTAANAALAATSTSGVVNDSASATVILEGVVAVEASGGMTEAVKVRLVWPTVQAVAAGGGGGGGLTVVTAGDVDSEASTDGQVLTSDGAGAAAWEASSGGGRRR